VTRFGDSPGRSPVRTNSHATKRENVAANRDFTDARYDTPYRKPLKEPRPRRFL